MSHIVEATTTITNPNLALLQKTAEVIAGQHQAGEVTNYYIDYYNKQHGDITLGIKTGRLHRGIGMKVDPETGALTFIGDSWDREQEYDAMKKQIVQVYVSLATIQALQDMGYQTVVDGNEEINQLVVTGVLV